MGHSKLHVVKSLTCDGATCMECQPSEGNEVGEVSKAEKSRKMVKIRKGHNLRKTSM